MKGDLMMERGIIKHMKVAPAPSTSAGLASHLASPAAGAPCERVFSAGARGSVSRLAHACASAGQMGRAQVGVVKYRLSLQFR
jgi:hypothetical protein